MTLRLSDEEHQRLERRAEADGISMQEAAKIAIREYLARTPIVDERSMPLPP